MREKLDKSLTKSILMGERLSEKEGEELLETKRERERGRFHGP